MSISQATGQGSGSSHRDGAHPAPQRTGSPAAGANAYPITVGDNVWIGAGVQVMPGVNIGSNVVIGGGSVVVKDIPSNSVAVGNPCKVIRPITEDDKKTYWDR